jgi:hypothetical protein
MGLPQPHLPESLPETVSWPTPSAERKPRLEIVPKQPSRCGPRNPNWKGGKSLEWTGYVRIWAGPDRGRYEHTVVWESIHGPLPEGWCVHHKDGTPWRNCPSNLEGMDQTVHNRISASRRWAGRTRKTAFDLTAKDMRYLSRRGVSIPKQFDVPF